MSSETDIRELHWMMGMLHSINVGLIVIDRGYAIQLWNEFMVNRSGKRAEHVIGKNIFELFPDVPERWLRRKTESVFVLENRAFTTWEQRPYLFKFKNYRPITGSSEYMYQDITFIPLQSVDGQINHIGIIIYDVTDIAVNKLALQEANRELESLSRTDRLTQLFNRGYWEECLRQEFMRVQRSKLPCSLMMFDIDHFKAVNDNYGHQAGDEVIRQTAATLLRTIRKTDIAGRYGGEEFSVILLDTAAADAKKLAERLRERIQALTVQHEGIEITFTISLGIAEFNPELQEHSQLIEHADQALYQSKEGGRNRTTVFSG